MTERCLGNSAKNVLLERFTRSPNVMEYEFLMGM